MMHLRSDRGGLLTLQKRWTSFLKARLVCSLPELHFHFNALRSVFVLRGSAPDTTDTFYGVFGLDWFQGPTWRPRTLAPSGPPTPDWSPSPDLGRDIAQSSAEDAV
ncbi:hypothetical protein CRUP_017312 [Coryphaenoides rupestris]|nr:hypothetical protein CRUP_017312 [Coryphaenoides rupestris]